MPLTIPNQIANQQAADGDKLGANFAAIQNWADTQVMEAGGPQLMPTGAVLPFAGTNVPSGYLLCDGAAVSRTTQAALFAVIGTKFGVGNGSTTFNVPNLKGRVPVGLDASVTVFNDVGKTGGQRDAIVPSHTHTGPSHTHSFSATSSSDSHSHTVDINHDHPAFESASDGAHTHSIANGGSSAIAAGSSFQNTVAGSAHQYFVLPTATGSAGAHTHTVNVPALGTTNKTTSSDAHTHTVSGTTGSGGTGVTGSTGESATDKNLQPFVVVTYVIKT